MSKSNLADEMLKLYHVVGNSPFYTHEVKHIFSANRIHSLVTKHFIEPTGKTTTVKRGTTNCIRNQWMFTTKGIKYANRYGIINCNKIEVVKL